MRKKYSFIIDDEIELQNEVELLFSPLSKEIEDFRTTHNINALKRYLLIVFVYRLEKRIIDESELKQRLNSLNPFYKLRGVSSHYNDVLNFLIDNPERIEINYDYIPHPLEVLKMQTRGKRPFSLFSLKEKMEKIVLRDKDYFSFFLHDLHHGEKFFSQQLEGQTELYLILDDAFSANGNELYKRFKGPLKERLDYLLSDMNTHVVHSLRYLRALCDDVINENDLLAKDQLFLLFFNQGYFYPFHGALLRLNRENFAPISDGQILFDMVKGYVSKKEEYSSIANP